MLLIKEFDLIFCSLNPMIGKLNFIILKILERLSICLDENLKVIGLII